MSLEAVTDQSLLNDDTNLSTVTEDSKCKKPSCIAIALIIVGIVCFIGFIVGLSVGLTYHTIRAPAQSQPRYQSIAFIAAMEEELTALLNAFTIENQTNITQIVEDTLNVSIIHYNGLKIIAALCGIGKVNSAYSTAVIIVKYHPDAVINVGVAGGFRKEQQILDFAIAESFVHTDVDITNLKLPPGQILGEPLYFPASSELTSMIKLLENDMNKIFVDEFPDCPRNKVDFHYGILGSSDQFIYRDDQVENIVSKFKDVMCVEMEGASIAHVCHKFKIPILAIRSLSDIAVSEDDNTGNYTDSVQIASKSAALLSILLIEKIAKG